MKAVKEKAEKTWSMAKKIGAMISVWALIFSIATVGKLGVAFDYDEVLVASAPAFKKGAAAAQQAYSPQFWEVVNTSYDLERPKLLPLSLAWLFRVCGFRVTVVTARPAIEVDGLKKEWRHLAPPGRFLFASDKTQKHQYLVNGNYLLFFGDSDSDVEQARQASVFPVRIRRAADSYFKDDYHPGTLGELVLPASQFAF
jgi:acid phosphatase (class B)